MISCGSLPSKDSLPESWIGYVFVESSKEEFVIVEFIKSASLVRYATLSPQQNQINAFECTIGVFREELRTNRLEFIREAKESERKNALGIVRSMFPSLQQSVKKKTKKKKEDTESIEFQDKDGSSIQFKVNARYKNLEQYVDKERVTKKVKNLSYDSKTLILRDDEEDIPFKDVKDADRVLTFLKTLCQNKIKFVLTIDGTAFDPRRARKQQEEQRKQEQKNKRKREKSMTPKAKTPTATPTPAASKRRRIEPSPFCSIPTGDDKTTLVFFANSKQGLLEIFHDDIRDMNPVRGVCVRARSARTSLSSFYNETRILLSFILLQ